MRFKFYVMPWLLNSIMLFVFLLLVYVLIENETNRIRQLCENASVVLDLVTSYTTDLKLLTNDLEVYLTLMEEHYNFHSYGDTALNSKGTKVDDLSSLSSLPPLP